MLTKEEATALYQLLGRVSLNGNEAEAVVALKQKLQQIAQTPTAGDIDLTEPKTTSKK